MVSWTGINPFWEIIILVIEIIDNRIIVSYPELVPGVSND